MATPEPPLNAVSFSAPPVVRAFIEDAATVTGYFGPFGCAKTSAAAIKAWGYGQVYPGARGAIIRSTWPQLRDTTMKTFMEWFPNGVAGEYEATPKTFWMHTRPGEPPQEILFRAMDQADDVANLLSLDLAWAWLDEPQGGISLADVGRNRRVVNEPGISHEVFMALLARVGRQRGYPKMIWLTGNPPPPRHWIADEFGYDPGDSGCDTPKNPRPDRHLYLGDQDTNRHNLPPGYYEDLERDYGVDTPMARRFLRGHWIDFVGEKPFKASDIIPWQDSEIELPSPLVIEAGVDPAISEKDTADTAAIVIAGQSRRGEYKGGIFELAHDEGRWGLYGTVQRMLAMQREWRVRIWRIEDVAYQRALGAVLEREARMAGLQVAVELVRPDADKIRRANAWSPLVEDGTFMVRNRDSALVTAMLGVPQDRTCWNLVDAAGICVRGFPLMQPEQSRLPGTEPEPKLAAGYAVHPPQETKPLAPERGFIRMKSPAQARAAGYAVRRPGVK